MNESMAKTITLQLDCGVRLQIETDASNFDPFNVTANDRQAFGLLQTLQNGRKAAPEAKKPLDLHELGYPVGGCECSICEERRKALWPEPPREPEKAPKKPLPPTVEPPEPVKWSCSKCGPRTDNQVKDRACLDCGIWVMPYDPAKEGKQPENPTPGRSKTTTRPKWETFNCSKCSKPFRELNWRAEGRSGRLPSTCDDCVNPDTLRNRKKARDAQIKKGNLDPSPLVAAAAFTELSASGTK